MRKKYNRDIISQIVLREIMNNIFIEILAKSDDKVTRSGISCSSEPSGEMREEGSENESAKEGGDHGRS